MVGYSFGSIIAIELIGRLEAMNFKGRLILIDGAPQQLQTMYKHFTLNPDDADLQIVVLTNIMEIYSSENSKEVCFCCACKKLLYLLYFEIFLTFLWRSVLILL